MNNSNPDSKSTPQVDDASLDKRVSQSRDDNTGSHKCSGEGTANVDSVATEGAEGDRVQKGRQRKLY